MHNRNSTTEKKIKKKMYFLLPWFLTTLILSSSISLAQQNYSGSLKSTCYNSDKTGPSPAFLYTCYHVTPSCTAFLIFRTKPPYLTISSISALVSSQPSDLNLDLDLNRINDVSSSTTVLPPGDTVVLPVRCSCSGQYYQANTSYVADDDDTYYTIATETYQGLTTCDALMRANPYDPLNVSSGLEFQVPLRCACPTIGQIANGTRFMLTFVATANDSLSEISETFNVSIESIASANGFNSLDPRIYPSTTILIPLTNTPSATTIKPSSPTMPRKTRHKMSRIGLFVGLGSGAALAVLCFALFLGLSGYYTRKRTINASKIRQGVSGIGGTLKVYTYEELREATDNFSDKNQLSKSIYRGSHRGNPIAVKKMDKGASKEIKILGNVNHFNLITLYGACLHGRVSYLVYEFLQEGSLKEWLHKENAPLIGSWHRRILIALDIASGLDYLHNCANPGYVHKDINSGNILLTGDLRAKIANFSLARDYNGDRRTNNVVGEKGYMAPEYVREGRVTAKTDVYAFGVVLLELITGKDAIALSNEIVSVFDRVESADDVGGLIDARLRYEHPLGYVVEHTELAWRLLKVAKACLARDTGDRLAAVEIVVKLVKILGDVQSSQ
ncbi:lysM domain receptor-like kinase 4 [Andrographis paniculata]|uniref:lysM domain receptor-like kinase 4 n=1 Tax=Andrographis paniculata TaxID=175694 RepID=UPI0021E93633|nr:lysM domain receptor-like kinase 4 [Andrographis paniculata]